MNNNIVEIEKEYKQKMLELQGKNALRLPSGLNNIYTLVYLPLFQLSELSIKQKGFLIHLLIRGGNSRVVFKSGTQIAATLGIDRTVYSRNLKKLEELLYIKRFEQSIEIDNRKLPYVIYMNPINDKTGYPIKSKEEEITLSLNIAKEYINKYSKYIVSIKEEEKKEIEKNLDLDNISIERSTNLDSIVYTDIFTPVYISFMENPLLTITDKVVYSYLALRSGQLNVFFESKINISKKIHISTKSLNQSLKNLEKFLYIRKFKRYDKNSGNMSSDVIYVNKYDHFNGLPEINEDIMYLKLNKAKELYFKDFIIKECIPQISENEKNKVFDSTLKSLLITDENISKAFYETFIECSTFRAENYNDETQIIQEIPTYMSALKTTIYSTVLNPILEYSRAILKLESDVKLIIEVVDK